jgi:hypothetical protein
MPESSLLELGEGPLRGEPEVGVDGAVEARAIPIEGAEAARWVLDDDALPPPKLDNSSVLKSGKASRIPAFLK